MQKKYIYSTTADLERMALILEEMKATLLALDNGEIPNAENYTRTDLFDYCESLVHGQRDSLGRTQEGSWSVAPNDDDMPADARIDFIFLPTYVAASILCRVVVDFPWIAIKIDGFIGALKKGLEFCTYRKLQGHGYESIDGMLEALNILSIGKVPYLLDKAPELSPALHDIFISVETELSELMQSGDTFGAWGEDYSDSYQNALETYYLMKDSELVNSVKSSDVSDCTKELDW